MLTWPLQEMPSSLDANADWLENMDKAVDHLSSKCPQSDVLDLRRDAEVVHALRADISSCLQHLVARTADTETEVCYWSKWTISVLWERSSSHISSIFMHSPFNSVDKGVVFWGCPSVKSVCSFGQILLSQYLMNGLSSLHETCMEYSRDPTDDLIRFWRSKVRVKFTAGRWDGQDIHVDAMATTSILFFFVFS